MHYIYTPALSTVVLKYLILFQQVLRRAVKIYDFKSGRINFQIDQL